MAITKVTSGLISADAASVDLNIDAGTLYIDATNNRVGIGTTNPLFKLHVNTSGTSGLSGAANRGMIVTDSIGARIILEDTGATSGAKNFMLRSEGDEFTISGLNDDGSSFTTQNMFVINGNTANVGIGASSPGAKLEIETSSAGSTQTKALLLDVNLTNNIGSGYLEIHSGTGSTAKTQIEQVAGGAGGLYGTYQDTNIINTTSSGIVAGNINFVTGGAIRMTVGGGSQAGNVGIGTTGPASILHLYANDPQILLDDSGTQSSITGQSGNILYKTSSVNRDHVFHGVNTEVARITGDGSVLVGTTNATTVGTVNKNLVVGSTTNNDEVAVTLNVMEGTNNRRAKLFLDDDNGVFGVDTTASTGVAPFVVRTIGTERMRIASGGDIFFGVTTDPSSSNAGAGFTAESGGRRVLRLATTATNLDTLAVFTNGNGDVGNIRTTGSSTQFNTSSDARLKEVTGEARGLAVINALNPVAYNWKADGKADEGLIAQEVENVYPQAVSEPQNDEEYYQMDYSKLVTPLIKAIQEQQEQIESLKSEIKLLKGEIND